MNKSEKPLKPKMDRVLEILKREYSDAHCSLYFKTPYQLLIATILSAQCTDERVNQVTPVLFKKFSTAKKMSEAKIFEIEEIVKSCGFYKNKAKSILETSKILVEKHSGKVPQNLDDLIALRGVGRKTANVVLGNAYGIPGLVVDTHVGRLSRRLGFTKETDPEKVEIDMMELVPREDWTQFSHLLISHGRAVCQSRSPKCEECFLKTYCPKLL